VYDFIDPPYKRTFPEHDPPWSDSELTPEQKERLKREKLAHQQKEHEASIKRQRSKIRPMDRSNVVERKRSR
jgi:hypothetical protein